MKTFYQALILLALMAVFTNANGQLIRFHKNYSVSTNEDFLGCGQCSDGGYIICGRAQNSSVDAYLVRMDAFGDTLWSKTYSSANTDYLTGVAQTTDGGFVAVGQVSQPNQAAIVLKVDANGNMVWQKFYSLAQGIQVIATANNGFVVGGGLNGVWLMKCDANGDAIWNKRYTNVGFDRTYRFSTTADGGYILSCETLQGANHGIQMYIVKTDANGTLEWAKSFGGNYDDNGWGVQQTPEGGYLMSGYTNMDTLAQGDYNIMLVKLSPSGQVVWKRIYDDQFHTDDMSYNMVKTGDGYMALAGNTKLNDNAEHYFLVKIDTVGDVKWSYTYNYGRGNPGAMICTADKGFLMAGYNTNATDGRDAYIIRTDSFGISCGQTIYKLFDVTPNAFYVEGAANTIGGTTLSNWNLTTATQHPALDGTECSTLLGVTDIAANNQIAIYPNPMQNSFTVNAGLLNNISVELYDMSGRKLLQQKLTGNQDMVDVAALSNGIYICAVIADNKVVKRERLVVSR